MQFDPNELEHTSVYKVIMGTIISRTLRWISSVSEDGINNLAPFSNSNAVGDDPPHITFSKRICASLLSRRSQTRQNF